MRHSPGRLGRRYGELLRALNLVSEEDVHRALAAQDKSGEDLDTILHENGVCPSGKILESVSQHFHLEVVDVVHTDIDPEVLNSIPVRMMLRRHR